MPWRGSAREVWSLLWRCGFGARTNAVVKPHGLRAAASADIVLAPCIDLDEKVHKMEKKTLVILVTALMSHCAAHAQWAEVGTTNQARMYIDKSTMVKESFFLRRIWTLMDFKEGVVNQYGAASVQTSTDVDCKAYSYRSLKIVMLSQPMAKGIVVKRAEPKPGEPNPMTAAPPGSMMDWVISQTCLI